uniref:ATP synthase F0 subunit 8 n=1 Tax=Micromelo undatus TaxID=340426 RepID=E6Y187_MICUD|nr:ATP synthase F0 subunit 8 [Micromelo undatus]ABK92260.1 ATP synthase F0 subunit 8 [Micromelo undatus]
MPQLSPMMGILFLVASVIGLLVLVISLRSSQSAIVTQKTSKVSSHKSSWI